MARFFSIPGKFSIDLDQVSSAEYYPRDQDMDAHIDVIWINPAKGYQTIGATPEEFAKFQTALAAHPK